MAQQFKQRQVETRFFIKKTERHPGQGTFAFKFYWQQNQGRGIGFRVVCTLLPFEKTNGQEQRVCATLLQVAACLAEQINQGCFKFYLFQSGEHFTTSKRLTSNFVDQVLVILLLVQGHIPATAFQVRHRQHANSLATGEKVFKRCRIRAQQAYAFCAVREMQETVAGRQIQQLALPQRQLARWTFTIRVNFDIEPRKCRSLLQPLNSGWSIGCLIRSLGY